MLSQDQTKEDGEHGQAEGSTKASDAAVDKQNPPALPRYLLRTNPEAVVGQYPVRGEQVEGWRVCLMSAHRAAQSASHGRATPLDLGSLGSTTRDGITLARAVRLSLLTEQPPEAPPSVARMQMEIARGLGG